MTVVKSPSAVPLNVMYLHSKKNPIYALRSAVMFLNIYMGTVMNRSAIQRQNSEIEDGVDMLADDKRCAGPFSSPTFTV